MSSANRRVVITGIGVVSALGMGATTFWDALSRGQCGIKKYQSLDSSELKSTFAAEISGFDHKKYLSKEARKQIKSMARAIQFAVARPSGNG